MKYWAERLSPLLDRHSFIIENRVSYESLFLSGSIAYSIQACNKCVFINLARTWKPGRDSKIDTNGTPCQCRRLFQVCTGHYRGITPFCQGSRLLAHCCVGETDKVSPVSASASHSSGPKGYVRPGFLAIFSACRK